jgi:glycosyltransferase involved in cell wall biosynthesis
MKILSIAGLVPWHPNSGGGQIIAHKISEALAQPGHDVHHVAIAPEEHRRELDGAEVCCILSGPSLIASIPHALQLSRSNRLDEYDIVHVHAANETLGYCLAHALARRLGPKPKLLISIYAPKAYAFPRSVGEIATGLSCHCADLVFSLSEFSKRDIARAYRVSSAKIVVTYAGVDSSFTPESHSLPRSGSEPFVLMYCGRMNGSREQKGTDVLLKSLPMVIREHDIVLNMVGAGPRLDQYRALAQQLNVDRHVRFLGFVEHGQMPAHYRQADLFVLPSRRESFGLVLAEAMACGLPVVATTAGAIPEVVDDGVTGILVPPDDPRALSNGINALLSDPAEMEAMGAAGRARVEKLFTWDKVVERVIAGYHKAP